MKGVIFAIFSFLVLVHCESPSSAEKEALVEALNRHRREAAPYNQLANWDDGYANLSQEAVQSCEKVETVPGLSHYVSTANSNYLVDAVDFWVHDGKEDEKLGCPRFACNDYHILISSHLSGIGCGYKDCPNLGGVYVVCQYDFILD